MRKNILYIMPEKEKIFIKTVCNDNNRYYYHRWTKMKIRILVVISLIVSEFVGIGKCVENELQESKEMGENFAAIKEEIKNEIIFQSNDEMRSIFDNVPRRKKTNSTRNTRISENFARFTFIKVDEIECSEGAFKEIGKYCKYCKITFRYSTTYEEHFRESHPNEEPYICPYCRLSHKFKKNFSRHVDRYHPDKVDLIFGPRYKKLLKLTCKLCNSEHSGRKALEAHTLTIHKGVRTMKCTECDAQFYRHYELTRHIMVVHRFQKTAHPFVCKFCRNCFLSSDKLEGHTIVCPKRQGMTGDIQVDIKELEILNRRTLCGTCGYKSRTLQELKEHTRENHPEVHGIFPCVLCVKTYSRRNNLEKHIAKHHPDYKDTDLKKKYAKVKYNCENCGDEFSGLRQYEKHIKIAHPNECPFRCLTCGRGFAKKWNLIQHLRNIHAPTVALLPCTYCTKYFGSMASVRNHERSCGKKIANRETFFCDICLKWMPGVLKAHKCNHHHYDYCDFCYQRFHKERNPEGLSEHVAKRHPNRVNEGVNALLIAMEIVNTQGRKIKQEE